MAYNKTGFNPILHAAVVPGISIAHHKLGELPHERPPQYTDKNEALEYIWKLLIQPKIQRQIWDILRMPSATVDGVTKAILYKASMAGIIQMNLAIVIAPLVGKMIYTIAKAGGVSATIGPETISPQKQKYIKVALKELLIKYDKKGWLTGNPTEAQPTTQQPEQPSTDNTTNAQPQGQSPSGIMGMAQQPTGGQ